MKIYIVTYTTLIIPEYIIKVQNIGNETFQKASFGNASFPNEHSVQIST